MASPTLECQAAPSKHIKTKKAALTGAAFHPQLELSYTPLEQRHNTLLKPLAPPCDTTGNKQQTNDIIHSYCKAITVFYYLIRPADLHA